MTDFKRDHKLVIAPEDEALYDEQKKTGAVMDMMTKREMFLQKNKATIVGDDSLLLYRLPLNEEQLASVYENIIKEAAKE